MTRHDQTVGYFIPEHGHAEADLTALKKASQSLDKLRSAKGVDVEDIISTSRKPARRALPLSLPKPNVQRT